MSIVTVVEKDAVLSSQVLRTVNSALFGLRHKVGSVERAVALMGMRAVRITDLHDDLSDLPEADAVVANHTDLTALLTA